ncbi:hypothetical protein U1Q18_017368 [Sarracenia purpurea var. burkii]
MPISAIPLAPAPSQVSVPVILPPKEGSPIKAYTRKKKGLQTQAVKGKGKGTMDPPKDPKIALMDAIIAEEEKKEERKRKAKERAEDQKKSKRISLRDLNKQHDEL